MRRRWSTSHTLAVLGALGAVPALFTLRSLFLHALSVHNRSDALVTVVCRPFVDVDLRPGDRRLSYAIAGRTFTCVVASSHSAASCGRTLRGLEDVYMTVLPDGELDCDDY